MGKWFKVHSVSSAIGRPMVLILFMASLIAVVAMVTLFYSVPDAKAINLSGSLRMQAYRMAYEIEKDQVVLGRLAQFEQTLHAPELQETQRWITPASLRRTYGEVLLQWQVMREHIENATPSRYTDNTEQFVAAIDDFVNQMQYHVEFKVRMLALAEGLGLLAIITIAWCTVRFTRQQVVAPLNQLVGDAWLRGELDARWQGVDLLRACFPGGSITGAPKIRAMEIIEELEPVRRNAYCGSIGYLSQHGRMDTSICIRTLIAEAGRLHCWAGGGIIADSDPDAEYQETYDKVARILPLLDALRQ